MKRTSPIDSFANDKKRRQSITNTHEAYAGKLALLQTYLELGKDGSEYTKNLDTRVRIMRNRLINKGGDVE